MTNPESPPKHTNDRTGRGDKFRKSDRGRPGSRQSDKKPEDDLFDRVVNRSIKRTACVVKGGRRFSFSAMVVVGDKAGSVGVGFGKANEVPPAVEKAKKEAKKLMRAYNLKGRTIPHLAIGRYGASTIKLIPASPGTGVIAGSSARAVLELVGVQDVLTKCYGSTNVMNVVKATLQALSQLTKVQP